MDLKCACVMLSDDFILTFILKPPTAIFLFSIRYISYFPFSIFCHFHRIVLKISRGIIANTRSEHLKQTGDVMNVMMMMMIMMIIAATATTKINIKSRLIMVVIILMMVAMIIHVRAMRK